MTQWEYKITENLNTVDMDGLGFLGWENYFVRYSNIGPGAILYWKRQLH